MKSYLFIDYDNNYYCNLTIIVHHSWAIYYEHAIKKKWKTKYNRVYYAIKQWNEYLMTINTTTNLEILYLSYV